VRDARGRHVALIRADGTLALGPVIGSIHKIGALAQGLPTCNGWTFWHVEREGVPLLIDSLRGEMRARMAA
jgi:modification methylase